MRRLPLLTLYKHEKVPFEYQSLNQDLRIAATALSAAVQGKHEHRHIFNGRKSRYQFQKDKLSDQATITLKVVMAVKTLVAGDGGNVGRP